MTVISFIILFLIWPVLKLLRTLFLLMVLTGFLTQAVIAAKNLNQDGLKSLQYKSLSLGKLNRSLHSK